MTPTQALPPQDNQTEDSRSTSYSSLMILILIVAFSITTFMNRRQHSQSTKAVPATTGQVPQKAGQSNLGTAENPVPLDEVVYSSQRP